MDLIFKAKCTSDLANSCAKRELQLETFCIHHSQRVPVEAVVTAVDFVLGVCTGGACDYHMAIDCCVSKYMFQLLVP